MTQSTPHPILTDRVRFGAAYYYEYHRPGLDPAPADLESDLDWAAAVISDSGVDGFSYAASAGCW